MILKHILQKRCLNSLKKIHKYVGQFIILKKINMNLLRAPNWMFIYICECSFPCLGPCHMLLTSYSFGLKRRCPSCSSINPLIKNKSWTWAILNPHQVHPKNEQSIMFSPQLMLFHQFFINKKWKCTMWSSNSLVYIFFMHFTFDHD